MSSVEGRRKARLMQQAENLIDELLDWTANTPEPNLAQIEQVVLELRQRFSEELAREVIEAQEKKQPAVAPACPRCGQAMSYKGQKWVAPQTWVGEVHMERGYYHCGACQEGLFPPG
jgi:hypothetical protein